VDWPVTQKDVWAKDGLAMSFFDQRPLLVYGRVAVAQGAISLEINRIEVLGNLEMINKMINK